MRKLLVGFAAGVLLATCADAAADRWTHTDTALQITFAGTLALDYLQTRQITDLCREANPIIGECGDRVSPDVYFPAAFAGHALVAAALPQPYRRIWQSVWVGAQTHTIYRNYGAGYTFRF